MLPSTTYNDNQSNYYVDYIGLILSSLNANYNNTKFEPVFNVSNELGMVSFYYHEKSVNSFILGINLTFIPFFNTLWEKYFSCHDQPDLKKNIYDITKSALSLYISGISEHKASSYKYLSGIFPFMAKCSPYSIASLSHIIKNILYEYETYITLEKNVSGKSNFMLGINSRLMESKGFSGKYNRNLNIFIYLSNYTKIEAEQTCLTLKKSNHIVLSKEFYNIRLIFIDANYDVRDNFTLGKSILYKHHIILQI